MKELGGASRGVQHVVDKKTLHTLGTTNLTCNELIMKIV